MKQKDMSPELRQKITDALRLTILWLDDQVIRKRIRSNLCDYSDAYILASGTIQLLEKEHMMLQNNQMKEIKTKQR